MKEELQQYLHKAFGRHPPYSTNDINLDYSVGGQVHIRFELGGELLRNGTRERVAQSSQRAVTLFEDTFPDTENKIWVLIYDYSETLVDEKPNFLCQQFPSDLLSTFYNQVERVCEYVGNVNELENEGNEGKDCKIIIGKVKVKDIKYQHILKAIANSEMGFEPAIDSRVYFIDPKTDRIFRMYDDRGCFVESNSADNLRELYQRRNDWIVDYHRPEIDKYFQ